MSHDTDDTFGFAYGTLPGHPEQGEESFTIRKGTEGNVIFEIVAFSRPSDPLVRMAGPLSRLIQRRATAGYLGGLADEQADLELAIPLAATSAAILNFL